jgi:hypothetical protein
LSFSSNRCVFRILSKITPFGRNFLPHNIELTERKIFFPPLLLVARTLLGPNSYGTYGGAQLKHQLLLLSIDS